jgi:hypothetical protein
MKNRKRIALLTLMLVAVAFLVWVAAGANRRVVHEMTWQYAEPAKEWPAAAHIVLSFVEYPDQYIGIYSPDLGDYLATLPSRRVRVVFEVSPVFGGMHGADWINPSKILDLVIGRLRGDVWSHQVRIGDLTQWHTDVSYTGRHGNSSSSPWD